MILLFALMMLLSTACSSSLATTEEGVTEEKKTQLQGNKTEEKEEDLPIALPDGFSAGFGRETVNPAKGTALGGWSTAGSRLSETVVDDIMVTCTAVSDGENIALLFSSDTIHVAASMAKNVANIAEKEFGVPAENVVMNATHSHSSPALYDSSDAGISKYLKKYYAAAEEIIDGALRDLAPANMLAGTANTENLSYVRRYVSMDGKTYIGGSGIPAGQDPAQVRHETEADTELRVLKFDRSDKKDIVLCNWQCHPTTTSSEMSTGVSADWVGFLRAKAEKDLDIHFSYQQGAAGNVVPSTKIKGEKSNSNHIKHGEAIADVVKTALNNAIPIRSGKVLAKQITFTADRSSPTDYKKTMDALLTVISFGDVGIGTLPGELHDTLGKELREKSPFAITLFFGYTNGTVGYLPAEFAYANGGYEVNSCRFVKGTPEKMVSELLGMLKEQYAVR